MDTPPKLVAAPRPSVVEPREGSLVLMSLVLTAPVVILIIVALRHWSRRLSSAVRPWALTAGSLLLAAGEVYVIGLMHMVVFWADTRNVCISRYQNWNGEYGQAGYWPLERKCTAFIDMVPAYVNPLVVVLLVAAAPAALIALGRAVFRRRS